MRDEAGEVKRVLISSGLGLSASELGDEVLRSMPEKFVFAYELLWLSAFGRSVGGRSSGGVVEPNVVSKARRVTRVSTNQTETRGGAKAGGMQGLSDRDVISNEIALEKKRRIDRKLRALARDIRSFISRETDRAGNRRCSSCKRFGDDEWVYCPWDGRPMEEI
jgi:hypothetical protein